MKKILTMVATLMVTAAVLATLHVSIFAVKNRAATLTNVKGTVTIAQINAAGKETQATNNMVLYEGDTMKTGKGSSVIVRFDDGSMMKAGPLSNMKLGKMAAGKGNDTRVDVGNGKVWTRVNKLGKDSSFSIKTPSAIAGVRGTYYASDIDKDAGSTFDVYDGSVAVSSVSSPGAQMLVNANQTSTVKKGKNPSKPTAIPSDRLEKGKNGFTESEFAASSFSILIEANPPTITAGGKSVVTVKVLRNGDVFKKELSLHLKLGGSAVFVNTGTSEADVSTGADGTVSLEITSNAKETISIDARLRLQVKKNK